MSLNQTYRASRPVNYFWLTDAIGPGVVVLLREGPGDAVMFVVRLPFGIATLHPTAIQGLLTESEQSDAKVKVEAYWGENCALM